MLVHEDPVLEKAAMEGELCIAVPVSVYKPECGECVITAYENVWDICDAHEKKYGDDILSEESVKGLFAAVAPVAEGMGYSADVKESRIIREYRARGERLPSFDCDENVVTVGDTAEVEGLECLLLHDPEPDPDDEEDVCTVIIKDGRIVALAGINDIADDDSVEIFVETAKDFRGRGYGTAVTAALVNHLARIGYNTAFNCAESNKASSAIAEKLGMTLEGRRYSLVCYGK